MHRFHHLVKSKHELRWDGKMFGRSFAGFYEERDVQGTYVHWEWLSFKWKCVADQLEAQEGRGMYGPKDCTRTDQAPG